MNSELRNKVTDQFQSVINSNSLENESNTPDWVLANYLVNCLEAFNAGVRNRDNFFGGKQGVNDEGRKEKW